MTVGAEVGVVNGGVVAVDITIPGIVTIPTLPPGEEGQRVVAERTAREIINLCDGSIDRALEFAVRRRRHCLMKDEFWEEWTRVVLLLDRWQEIQQEAIDEASQP